MSSAEFSGPMQLALVLSALMLKNQTFLSQEAKRLSALDGDEVFIEIDKNANALKGTSAEGHVVEINRHDVHQVVGTFVALNDDEKEQTGLIGFVKSRIKKSLIVFI